MLVLVAVAHAVQTAAGFGAGLVLITIGAHFVELPALLALVLPLSLVQTSWIVVRNRRSIAWRSLLMRVVPLMGMGVAVGYLVSGQLQGRPVLKQLLGAIVVVLAGRELWLLRRQAGLQKSGAAPACGASAAGLAAMFGAGLVHGVYATGGPLLVYGLGQEGLDRARFRATICTVWWIMNMALVVTFAVEGRYSPAVLAELALLMLALPIGIFAGERVFVGVDERTFKVGIYGLLMLAGLPLLVG